MDIKINPRPNHKMTRCCGNCKFFIIKTTTYKYGHCLLPDGVQLSQTPGELKKHLYDFSPTHAFCYCANHQWKPKGYVRNILKYAGVKDKEIG